MQTGKITKAFSSDLCCVGFLLLSSFTLKSERMVSFYRWICIILGTSNGYEREMSTFLKSAPLIWPRFLKVAFIGRHLKALEFELLLILHN